MKDIKINKKWCSRIPRQEKEILWDLLGALSTRSLRRMGVGHHDKSLESMYVCLQKDLYGLDDET